MLTVPEVLYLKSRSVSSASPERSRIIKKVKRDRKTSEPPIYHRKYRLV